MHKLKNPKLSFEAKKNGERRIIDYEHKNLNLLVYTLNETKTNISIYTYHKLIVIVH